MTEELYSMLDSSSRREREQRAVADEARRRLEREIVFAVGAGATYRQVAEAVGVTPGRIGQIVKKARDESAV